MSSEFATRSDVQEMIDISISNFLDLVISDDPLLTQKEKEELKAVKDPVRKANQIATARLISVARLAQEYLVSKEEKTGLVHLLAITKGNGGAR